MQKGHIRVAMLKFATFVTRRDAGKTSAVTLLRSISIISPTGGI